MASCAAIHYIYKKFKEIQEEVKFSVKEYNRQKNRIETHLDSLTQDFKQSSGLIGEREMTLKKLRAKADAAQFLVEER